MDLMLVLLAATAFPVACLAFVLWMSALEDSIPAGVRRAVREADPPPILALPVRRTAAPAPAAMPAPQPLAALPAQAARRDLGQRSDGAGSAAASFSLAGGSTNR